ncbi:MAG: DUF2029 domain-containing protein [Bdellovibrionales bacterium]|nr:DUF2029 domain-containing protein [Bdellovibrionales bacterium]
MNGRTTSRRLKLSTISLAAVCCLVLLAASYFSALNAASTSGVRDGRLEVQDFLYHLILVREFWFGAGSSLYDLSGQTLAMAKYFGEGVNSAMPVGVSPAALLIWYPFALISLHSYVLAQTLWIFCGLVLFVSGIYRLVLRFPAEKIFLMLFASLALFSWNGIAGVLLGQTSFLAAGILLHFAASSSASNLVWPLVWGVLLALKPTYFLFGLAYAVAYHKRASLLPYIAGGLLAALGASLCSSTILPEYAAQLSAYTSGSLPASYSGALHFQSNNTVRAVLGTLVGDSVVARTDIVLLALILAALTVAAMLRPRFLAPAQYFVGVVGVVSMLIPYFGGYEELVVAAVVAICWTQSELVQSPKHAVLGAALLFIILSHNALPSAALALALKAAVLLSAWLAARQ